MMERTEAEAEQLREQYEDNFVSTLVAPDGVKVFITDYGIAHIELETVLDNDGYIH